MVLFFFGSSVTLHRASYGSLRPAMNLKGDAPALADAN